MIYTGGRLEAESHYKRRLRNTGHARSVYKYKKKWRQDEGTANVRVQTWFCRQGWARACLVANEKRPRFAWKDYRDGKMTRAISAVKRFNYQVGKGSRGHDLLGVVRVMSCNVSDLGNA